MISHSLKALLHALGLMASLLLAFNLTGLFLGGLLALIAYYLGAVLAVIIGIFVCLLAAFGPLAVQAGYYQWYFGAENYEKQEVGCIVGVFMLGALAGGAGYFFYSANTLYQLLQKDNGKLYEVKSWNDFPDYPNDFYYWKLPTDYEVDTNQVYYHEARRRSSSKGSSTIYYTDHICYPIKNYPDLYWALSLKNGDSRSGRTFKSLEIARQRLTQKTSYFLRLEASDFAKATRPSTGEGLNADGLFLQAIDHDPQQDRAMAWEKFWYWVAQCNLGASVLLCFLGLSFFYTALTAAKK